MTIDDIEKEFRERFPNLNDSTEKGGYDAKEYVLDFFRQKFEEYKEDLVREIREAKDTPELAYDDIRDFDKDFAKAYNKGLDTSIKIIKGK